jgi:Tol biopolymer transport system component/DNA-binding winged helix-turn-helix (wHTH) protein
MPPPAHSYRFGPYLLVTAERVLLCQGQRVALNPKAYETLLTLVESAGHIVSKETLLKRVWPDTVVQEDSLTFNISSLRKTLGTSQQFIQTEHKLGYRFVAAVERQEAGDRRQESENNGAAGAGVSGLGKAIGAGAGAGTANGLESNGVGAHQGKIWALAGLALLGAIAGMVWLAAPRAQPKILKYDQITTDGRRKGANLVTDGARLYLTEQASTGWVVAQVAVSGGEPVAIASTAKESFIADITPDHRDLLVVEGGQIAPIGLEVVPLLGGEPRRLGNLRAYSAAWSPDGATLAYSTDGGVFLCDADGSNSRQIVTMSGQLICVHWSPKGEKLSFTRSEPSGNSIWEVGRDGKGLVSLYPGLISDSPETDGFWTPNGKYLVSSTSCGGHLMPSAVRVPSNPFARSWGKAVCLGFGPLDLGVSAISPDGSRLFAFESVPDHPQMEVYDARDGEFKPFLPNVSAEYADFSRDGQRIAYITGNKEITGAENLWISQIDGSHKVQITKPPLRAQLPRWSPDGKWLAFTGKEPGQAWRVRVVYADGGSYAPVTPLNDEEGAPTWSPDGAQLAFGGMTQPPERTMGKLVIHTFNLKTGQLSNVPGSEGLWTARWSPDGRYIAALTQDSRNLMLFDFHTGRWTKLATLAQIPDVVWSRHEEVLYFNGGITVGDRAIFQVKIPGGKVERVASINGMTDRGWLGLTPDDSLLIARIVGTQEIYALTVDWP